VPGRWFRIVPNLFVIAGPNGAGKSTSARRLLTGARSVAEFVNADDIAVTESVGDIEAGRIMLQKLDELAHAGLDFAIETTLASRSLRLRIESLQAAGYFFHLTYVWLPSADMAVQRVAARVRAGGHAIPEPVIRRRYARGLDNFFNLYMPIADAWQMADNSWGDTRRLIASRDPGGPMRIENPELWQRLTRDAMKTVQKAEQQLRRVPTTEFKAEEVIEAMQLAVREAIARHKALGQSIVVWRDGQIVVVPPEEIEI
jgi:predicted ABC-type ATPase